MFLEHKGVTQVEGTAVLLAVRAEPELRRVVRVQPVQEFARGPAVDHTGQYRMYGVGEGFALIAAPSVRGRAEVGQYHLPVRGDDDGVVALVAFVFEVLFFLEVMRHEASLQPHTNTFSTTQKQEKPDCP